MNVAQYTFQSPYSSAFQVGRPDPSSAKSDTTGDSSGLVKSTNTTLNAAQSFEATQTSEVTPTVDSAPLLDIYA
jgi:hypothetical protein